MGKKKKKALGWKEGDQEGRDEIKRQKERPFGPTWTRRTVKLFDASICLYRGGDAWTSLTHLHLNDKKRRRRLFRSPRASPFAPHLS